jgi:hypothetical protein
MITAQEARQQLIKTLSIKYAAELDFIQNEICDAIKKEKPYIRIDCVTPRESLLTLLKYLGYKVELYYFPEKGEILVTIKIIF